MKQKAVGLVYPEGAEAPFITVNVQGHLAEKVLEIAEKHKIPIEKDKVLADTLSLYEVGSYIPENTYEVLAKIFAFIQRSEKLQND